MRREKRRSERYRRLTGRKPWLRVEKIIERRGCEETSKEEDEEGAKDTDGEGRGGEDR